MIGTWESVNAFKAEESVKCVSLEQYILGAHGLTCKGKNGSREIGLEIIILA